MGKILITGYTTRMFGSKQVRGDYITFSYLLEEILKEMGHEVERRKVRIGEDLKWRYHYAFCGVAPLSSMTSGQVPQTHYAMEEMERKHAVYADDWSFCGYGSSVRYALERWQKYLTYKQFGVDSSFLMDTQRNLTKIVKADRVEFNAPVLAPMFPWGDHDFLMRDNYIAKLWTIDPSAWVKFPNVTCQTFHNRKKQWVMAALSDHTRWANKQGFVLPVYYVGNKRMGDGFVLTEDQTVQLFANSFGVLACGYPSAGSGWWRTRYLNAAWAETLVYTDKRDQLIMGDAFSGSPDFFENIRTSGDYDSIVTGQREWLEANISKKEEVMQTLERLMKS
jgi:hypothetical protein